MALTLDHPLELTERDCRILLWHLDVVDHAYHNIAPAGTAEDALREKLRLLLFRHEAGKHQR